jgi:hypothetical protein
LHKVIPGKIYNPYQKVISIVGQTLEPFDDDNLIPAYGFGDTATNDEDAFCFLDKISFSATLASDGFFFLSRLLYNQKSNIPIMFAMEYIINAVTVMVISESCLSYLIIWKKKKKKINTIQPGWRNVG